MRFMFIAGLTIVAVGNNWIHSNFLYLVLGLLFNSCIIFICFIILFGLNKFVLNKPLYDGVNGMFEFHTLTNTIEYAIALCILYMGAIYFSNDSLRTMFVIEFVLSMINNYFMYTSYRLYKNKLIEKGN